MEKITVRITGEVAPPTAGFDRPIDAVALGSFIAAGIHEAIEDGSLGAGYTASVISAYTEALEVLKGHEDPTAIELRELLQDELKWIGSVTSQSVVDSTEIKTSE